jgi:hypothetical protein
VAADVGAGFVATEAPALQQAFRSALRLGDPADGPVEAEFALQAGAAERVVVVWRNAYVGFVPTSHLASLRGQLVAAGRARLVAPGQVYRDGALWRAWLGPVPDGGPPPVGEGYDELEPPPPTIFGIPLGSIIRRHGR